MFKTRYSNVDYAPAHEQMYREGMRKKTIARRFLRRYGRSLAGYGL